MGPAETLTGMLTERIGRPAWRLSGLWKEEHVGLILFDWRPCHQLEWCGNIFCMHGPHLYLWYSRKQYIITFGLVIIGMACETLQYGMHYEVSECHVLLWFFQLAMPHRSRWACRLSISKYIWLLWSDSQTLDTNLV